MRRLHNTALIEWNTASNLTQTQTISCCPDIRQQGLQLQSLHSSINVISSPNFKMWFVMEMLLYAKKKKICGEWGQISWNLLYWVSLCREMRARVTVQTVSVLSSTSWGNWPSLLPYTHTHAHNVFFIFYFFCLKKSPLAQTLAPTPWFLLAHSFSSDSSVTGTPCCTTAAHGHSVTLTQYPCLCAENTGILLCTGDEKKVRAWNNKSRVLLYLFIVTAIFHSSCFHVSHHGGCSGADHFPAPVTQWLIIS